MYGVSQRDELQRVLGGIYTRQLSSLPGKRRRRVGKANECRRTAATTTARRYLRLQLRQSLQDRVCGSDCGIAAGRQASECCRQHTGGGEIQVGDAFGHVVRGARAGHQLDVGASCPPILVVRVVGDVDLSRLARGRQRCVIRDVDDVVDIARKLRRRHGSAHKVRLVRQRCNRRRQLVIHAAGVRAGIDAELGLQCRNGVVHVGMHHVMIGAGMRPPWCWRQSPGTNPARSGNQSPSQLLSQRGSTVARSSRSVGAPPNTVRAAHTGPPAPTVLKRIRLPLLHPLPKP